MIVRPPGNSHLAKDITRKWLYDSIFCMESNDGNDDDNDDNHYRLTEYVNLSSVNSGDRSECNRLRRQQTGQRQWPTNGGNRVNRKRDIYNKKMFFFFIEKIKKYKKSICTKITLSPLQSTVVNTSISFYQRLIVVVRIKQLYNKRY